MWAFMSEFLALGCTAQDKTKLLQLLVLHFSQPISAVDCKLHAHVAMWGDLSHVCMQCNHFQVLARQM